MTRYILKRLVMLIPVLLGISLVTFGMLRLIPGDPARIMLGEHATAESIARFRESMGLDDPIPVQYVRYLRRLVRGDLGRSIARQEWVTVEIAQRLPATIELSLGAMLVATVVGVSAGIISAYKHILRANSSAPVANGSMPPGEARRSRHAACAATPASRPLRTGRRCSRPR